MHALTYLLWTSSPAVDYMRAQSQDINRHKSSWLSGTCRVTHGRLLITFLTVSELQVSCANGYVIFRFVVIYLIIVLLISAHTCSHCSGIPTMRHKLGTIVPTRLGGAPWSAPLEFGNQDIGKVLYYSLQTYITVLCNTVVCTTQQLTAMVKLQ